MATYADYEIWVYLLPDVTKEDGHPLIASRLAARLSGTAWENCSCLHRAEVKKKTGVDYFLTTIKGAISGSTGQHMSTKTGKYVIQQHRLPMQSMQQYVLKTNLCIAEMSTSLKAALKTAGKTFTEQEVTMPMVFHAFFFTERSGLGPSEKANLKTRAGD